MSFLHEPGDLARTPLAAILLEALNLRATGVLTVHHGGGTSRLFIQEGKPVGAQVVTGLRPLGHMLLQSGAIDIDTLSRSLALMAETRRPQGEILIEMGAVSREQVDQALTEQQAGYFNLIAALEEGAYAFDAATPISCLGRPEPPLAAAHHRGRAGAAPGGRARDLRAAAGGDRRGAPRLRLPERGRRLPLDGGGAGAGGAARVRHLAGRVLRPL